MYAIVPDIKLYYNDQKLCQIIVNILNIIKLLWYKLILYTYLLWYLDSYLLKLNTLENSWIIYYM